MSNGWEVYHFIILAGLVGTCPIVLVGLVRLGLKSRKTQDSVLGDQNQLMTRPAQSVSSRYQLPLGIALLCVAQLACLLPIVASYLSALKSASSEGVKSAILVAIFVSVFLLIGVLFALKKGDLNPIVSIDKDQS